MKILVASINFYPDHSGIAIYSTDLPMFFSEQGHTVSMVTGFSYYPKWEKMKNDKWILFRTELFKKIKVFRGFLFVPKTVNTPKRILHEISFVFFAFFNFIKAGRQDCIVIISPPLLLGLIGVLFKWLWKAQLVFHIQDLQPDAALSLGMIKPGIMIRILQLVEKFIYKNSTWVATITKGMRNRLLEKGIPEDKLGLYYNWIDVEKSTQFCPKVEFLEKNTGVKGKFVIAYAGNIGVKQGVDVLVGAAEYLQNEKQIHILVIGEGAELPRLKKFAEQKRLENLSFLPFLSTEDYNQMLSEINLSFVAQKPKTGNVFFPSKLLGIMAMGKPLLVSADLDSELSLAVLNGGFGFAVSAGDSKAVAEAIRDLSKNPGLCYQMGEAGKKAVLEWDRNKVLGGFLDRIKQNSTSKSE